MMIKWLNNNDDYQDFYENDIDIERYVKVETGHVAEPGCVKLSLKNAKFQSER